MAVALAGALAMTVAGAQHTASPQAQRIELGVAAQRYPFVLYSNRPWASDLRGVTSAVVIVHGLGRNARGYYAAAEKQLTANPTIAGETLLIVPQYFATADAATQPLDGLPQWRGSRWNRGEDAVNWPWPLSSFQPLDDLLAAFLEVSRFPQLQRIVVAGHSAGGQIVHRYAVLNGIDERVRAAGKRLSYVVANPSSYLYFTGDRAAVTGWAPRDTAVCPGYNRYRYGVENLLRYAQKLDGMALFRRYAARDVAYLLGTADNDPEHPQLDQSCGARVQGSHRLERGRNYIRYERHLAGTDAALNRRVFDVIGVGHTQSRMLGSQCGAALLFGIAAEKNVAGAACRVPTF